MLSTDITSTLCFLSQKKVKKGEHCGLNIDVLYYYSISGTLSAVLCRVTNNYPYCCKVLHGNYCFENLGMAHYLRKAIKLDVKATIYAISSDTHQLQLIKLHNFKQEIF